MFSRRNSTSRIGSRAVLIAAVTAVLAAPAPALPTETIVVEGALDYQPLTAGVTVESVITNTVTLTFSPEGGPFEARASLVLGHDIPSRGCRFESTHVWEISGEFRPATLQFSGNYREVTEQTIGACDNFTFARTFDPDGGTFLADLDPLAGTIASTIDPLNFVLTTDPAGLASLRAEEPPPAAPNALTEILDTIRDRQDPVRALGAAVGVTSDSAIVTNDFSVDFNPLGGQSTLTGEIGVRTDQVLDDGRSCSWITRQMIEGSGEHDSGNSTITGTFQLDIDRQLLACDFETTFDAPPPISGTYALTIDTVAGTVAGEVSGFPIGLSFDPGVLPVMPEPQFNVQMLQFSLDADLLRVGIMWDAPWPPDEVDSLLVAGEVTTPDGPIVVGFRLDRGTPSVFMDPAGAYSAIVTEDGRTVLQFRSPALADVEGNPIRITTWYADTPGDTGTRLAVHDDEINLTDADPGVEEGILRLPFALPGFWEAGDTTAPVGEEPLTASPDDDQVVETAVRADAEPVTTSPDDGGGVPWQLVVIPIVVIGAVPLLYRWRQRWRAGASTVHEVVSESTVEETITVTSESPLLDARKIAGGTPVTAGELDKIPSPRDPFDVIEPDRQTAVDDPPLGLQGANIDELARTGGCEELMRAWQAATTACNENRHRREQLSREFDEAVARQRRSRRELDALPSEETRVELPDGTTLSRLDLDLRRRAAGAAWDAYLSDPTPETARVAEQAWAEQATPEWRAAQARAHQQLRDDLQRELDGAQADSDRLHRELTTARRAEQHECDAAAELKRQLDACLGRAAAGT